MSAICVQQCPVKSQLRHCQRLVLREAVHIRTLTEYRKVSGNVCLDMPNLASPLHCELLTGQKTHDDLILQFCKSKLTSFVRPLSCSKFKKLCDPCTLYHSTKESIGICSPLKATLARSFSGISGLWAFAFSQAWHSFYHVSEDGRSP